MMDYCGKVLNVNVACLKKILTVCACTFKNDFFINEDKGNFTG